MLLAIIITVLVVRWMETSYERDTEAMENTFLMKKDDFDFVNMMESKFDCELKDAKTAYKESTNNDSEYKAVVNIINSKIKKGKDKIYFESLNDNTVKRLRADKNLNYNVKKYNTIFSSYKYCVSWNPKKQSSNLNTISSLSILKKLFIKIKNN